MCPLGAPADMSGEHDFLRWLAARPAPGADRVPIPIGDDLAALSWGHGDLCLVGADQVIDKVHFDAAAHPPRAIGAKAVNRNLSDCAAMAALPVAAVATMALPRGAGQEYARELYLGMSRAAAAFDCPVVGGDTASHDGRLVVTVTILARAAGVAPVRRTGAKPGHHVHVTGALGGSLLGRHMTFEPRVTWGRLIAQTWAPSAMIDLSDGLSRDLAVLCQASGGVGAVIDADHIPIHDDALRAARADGATPLQHALHDGEDYELLFTAEQPAGIGRWVGRITAEPGIRLRMADGSVVPVEPKGWDHAL